VTDWVRTNGCASSCRVVSCRVVSLRCTVTALVIAGARRSAVERRALGDLIEGLLRLDARVSTYGSRARNRAARAQSSGLANELVDLVLCENSAKASKNRRKTPTSAYTVP